MLRRANLIFLLLAAVFTTVLAAALSLRVEWLRRIEAAAADRIAVLGRKAPTDPSLVYLGIGEASLRLDPELDVDDLSTGGTAAERRALGLMAAGKWPWSREIYALAVERLVAAGARAVIFDLSFPTAGVGDGEFRRALEMHAGRVVLAGHLQRNPDGSETFIPPSVTLVSPALREEGVIGFDNCWTATDQVIRRATFRISDPHHESLVARAMEKGGFDHLVPPGHGSQRIRFAGGPGTFAARPFYEIFATEFWRRQFQDGEFFRDKIVVIGKSGNWIQDDHLTPMGLMEGPEIHMNIANAVLTRELIRDTTPWEDALIVSIAGLLAVLLTSAVSRPFMRLGILAAVAGAWIAGTVFVFNRTPVLLPAITPVIAWLLIGGTGFVSDLIREQREKGRVRATLDRYVSSAVVEELLGNRRAFNAALGGSVREITVLFSDIRNFTHLSAVTEAPQLVAQLNEYFTAMVRCVFDHGGTLDKFMGDAVMAVWGNVRSDGADRDAMAAVRCAFAMRIALADLNEGWRARGLAELDIGIALNQGDAVCGNIGAPNRMEFTVIGDVVNVAWRIQEFTKQHPGEILIGENLVPLITTEFDAEPAGSVPLLYGMETGFSRAVARNTAALALATGA